MELRHLRQTALASKVMALVASPMQKKLLNLCHDWLETFLPHCLVKVNRVSYGLLNDEVSALQFLSCRKLNVFVIICRNARLFLKMIRTCRDPG